jgi:hypothetical protein
MRRSRDWIWIAGYTLTIAGFSGILVVGLMHPLADISTIDGRCRIGIPRYVTLPLVLYDVGLNVLLTFVFVYLLSPLIRSGPLPATAFPASRLTLCLGTRCQRSRNRRGVIPIDQGNQHTAKTIEKLLLRTFVGSILVMIPTVGNMAAQTAYEGRELGWVCMTVCVFDGISVFLADLSRD